MKSEHKHEFHFIIDKRMKEKLMNLHIFNECKGLSGIIVKILKIFTHVVKREHKWGSQRFSQYKVVCNDPDKKREHVHVYMESKIYRELKLLHQDLNIYSIAQLVRELIDLFLGFVDMYGDNVFNELNKEFTHWIDEVKRTRLTRYEYIRQLKKIIMHLPGKNPTITIYNTDFSPFWIFRT